MRRLTIWTGKGGTGKTTAALNVAAALGERGRRVLLVDLDPQASLTRGLGEAPTTGLLEVLEGEAELEELVAATRVPGVSLVRSAPNLDRAERRLAGEAGAEKLLDLAVARLPERWDYLLLDAPPGVNLLSVGALVAALEHVAPIEPAPYSVAGLADSLELVEAVRERLNPRLAPSRILISRVPRTRAARLTSEGLRERFGELVYQTEIPERAVVVEASAKREPLVSYASETLPAEAFRWWAQELEA